MPYKLTNELNLPQALVEALERDDYNRSNSDYTVTELITPPRLAQLRRQHSAVLVDDASNRIFSLLGQAIHVILERSSDNENYIVERRYSVDLNGITVSGQIDLYHKNTEKLQDWKITSYHSLSDGPKPEWIMQANFNRFILGKNGINVKGVEYVAIFRDWSKMMAARRNDYPQHQVRVLSLPLWPDVVTAKIMNERIALHEAAKTKLPMCSEEERWTKPHKWAVMLKGKKRALKLHDSENQAKAHISNLTFMDQPKAYIEERLGEETRCLFFCPVAAYCDFGREVIRNASKL